MNQGTIAQVEILGTGHVVEIPQRDFAEIYPGEFMAPCPIKHAPKAGHVKFMRVEGRLYEPVIHALPFLVTAANWTPERYGCSWKSAVKLAMAGFIKYERPVPGRIVIDLDSYFEHRANARRDPNFWTRERRAQLATADETYKAMRHELEDEDDEDTDASERAQGRLF
jgi:hypothetical protein